MERRHSLPALVDKASVPVRSSAPLKARVTMSEDHRETLAELAITDLERTADEYRPWQRPPSVAVRNSLTRLADRSERLVEKAGRCRAAHLEVIGAIRSYARRSSACREAPMMQRDRQSGAVTPSSDTAVAATAPQLRGNG